MITTLAPTSTERILEVTVDASVDVTLALSRAGSLSGPRAGLSTGGAAAAAWAARRAAAMKFEVLVGSRVPAVISLIALSEAAMRDGGDSSADGSRGALAGRPAGRACCGRLRGIPGYGGRIRSD